MNEIRNMARNGKNLSTQQRGSLIEKRAQRAFDLAIGEKTVEKKAVKRPITSKQGDIRARIKAKVESKQAVSKSKPKDKGMEK